MNFSRVCELVWIVFIVGCTGSKLSWIQAGNGAQKMCAAVKDTCNSVETCTWHAFGPCGGATKPDFHVAGQVVGLGLIKNETKYLTDETNYLTVLKVDPVSNNGYVKSEDNKTDETATYAYITAGAYFGDSDSGGYIGMATYVVQKGEVEFNKNGIMVGDYGQTTTEVHDVCVSPLKEDKTCGDPQKYSAGDYKFSLFGYTRGSTYSVPAAVTHLAIRTKLTLTGVAATVTVNGKKKLSEIGSANVNNVTFTETGGKKRVTRMVFPTKYNVGDIVQEGGKTKTKSTATKAVMIKASSAGANAIYIDYLFDKNDLTAASKYFVYDPTVQEKPAATNSGTSGTPGTSGNSESVSGASHTSFFSAFIILGFVAAWR